MWSSSGQHTTGTPPNEESGPLAENTPLTLSAVLSRATPCLGQTEVQQAKVRSPPARPRCRRSPAPQCTFPSSAPGSRSRVVCKAGQRHSHLRRSLPLACAVCNFIKTDPGRAQVRKTPRKEPAPQRTVAAHCVRLQQIVSKCGESHPGSSQLPRQQPGSPSLSGYVWN